MTGAVVVRHIDLAGLWSYLRARNGPVFPAEYCRIVDEVVAGRVDGAFAGDRIIAIGGVAPIAGSAVAVAWLDVVGETFGASASAVVRAMRKRVADAASGGLQVRAVTAPGAVDGERMARLIGLESMADGDESSRIWRVFSEVETGS